jgi:ribosomal protein S18 acetylase RimI-like enzyme
MKPTETCALIRPLQPKHAAAVAKLHMEGINTGFLSSLGGAFLRQLYTAIPQCPCGFGFVWEENDGTTLGFIACTENTGRLYRQALLRRGLPMAMPLAKHALRPSVVGRMIQTLRYPGQIGDDLPAAEVLAIAVDAAARSKGIGKALMDAAIMAFSRRGIPKVKVAVWAENDAANQYYRRCGFALARSRLHHNLPMNIYVMDVPPEKSPAKY